MLVTVFTPTYNRANTLKILYKSLLAQTNKNFEWVVVDDGSTDETSALIKEFINENNITIQFKQQYNQGKHIAINQGAMMAKGELFFTVDSDDYLLPVAIEQIDFHWSKILNDANAQNVIGIGANRIFENGDIIGGLVDYQVLDMDLIEYRFRKGYKGDKAEIYLTTIVQQNQFPQIQGETFCPEALIFYRLANEGKKLRFINENWYVCEYLDGGLTNSGLNTIKKGPIASLCSLADVVSFNKVPFLAKIKYAILFWRFSFWEDKISPRDKLAMLPNSLWILIYPLGWILYKKDIKQHKLC